MSTPQLNLVIHHSKVSVAYVNGEIYDLIQHKLRMRQKGNGNRLKLIFVDTQYKAIKI